MKIALVTTTINIPHVLKLYRKAGPDVRFFIAGDLHRANTIDIEHFFSDFENAVYLGAETQRHLGYECSELIGWNCIQRRNIATLEALRWGADVIVSIDDDNVPINLAYFYDVEAIFLGQFSGLAACPNNGWWSPYHNYPHLGFPHDKLIEVAFAPVVDLPVGVAAGLCLGDPDIDAYTRMSRHPQAWHCGEVGRSGYVVVPGDSWTVFNSQNTSFIRQLAPAMFMLPGVGRYDDIFASLITQRLMRETGHVVHFGPPFVWQQRNTHNLISDLKAELLGMEHVEEFADFLSSMAVPPSGVHAVRAIYEKIETLSWFPKQAIDAGHAWLDDCVRAMS